MTVKIVAFLALAVYQVSAQCCGPRPIQVAAQQIATPQVVNKFVPNVVTNFPNQVVTNIPAPVIRNPVVTTCNGYNRVVSPCANPVVPQAVFATSYVDNSVANSLANALQLLIVSDLIESTINDKKCPTVVETVDICQDYSYPQLVATDLYPCNPCNPCNACNSCNPCNVDVYPDVVGPLSAQLTLGYNLPVVSVNVDSGCGCSGYCGCPSTKYYF